MVARSLRADVLDFLATRPVMDGETIECGWFIFTVRTTSGRTNVETLDFRAMASFTNDFSEPERINQEQIAVLSREGVGASPCTLRDAAVVSQSYVPGQDGAFIHRLDNVKDSKSGWFVGVLDDPQDVNDPKNLRFQSLYELSIRDMRFAPYWLLPVGFLVGFDAGEVHVGRS